MKRSIAILGALGVTALSVGVLATPASALAPRLIDSYESAEAAPAVGVPSIPGSGTIGIADEAWYNVPFTCDLPTGCLPLPNLLAKDTLHVSVVAGFTAAVTALKLDTDKLPKGAEITEGELSLPVDATLTNLSLQPETAGFKACMLTEDFTPGEGLTVAPPKSDCGVSNPATYVPGKPAKFVIDLQPFADAWKAGTENHGILLQPFSTAASDHATWGVSFLSTKKATDLTKITAALKFMSSAAADGSPSPVASPEASASAGSGSSTEGSGSGAAPVATNTTPQNPAPVVQQQPQTRTNTAGFAGKGYAYPIVWLLPVALLAGCVWVGRLLTKSLDPAT